jgi:hypothetical protein
MRGELRPSFVLGDVAQQEPEPLSIDAHNEQTDAAPGVEPAMQQAQLIRGSRPSGLHHKA